MTALNNTAKREDARLNKKVKRDPEYKIGSGASYDRYAPLSKRVMASATKKSRKGHTEKKSSKGESERFQQSFRTMAPTYFDFQSISEEDS